MSSRKLSRKFAHGFTLIEVVVALMIVAAMGTLFIAVFPVALRSSTSTSYYTQAASLAAHKIEQLRMAGYADLLSPSSLASLGIVDTGSVQGSSLPYTVTFTGVDSLVSGSSGASLLPSGSTGTIAVSDAHSVNSSIPAGTALSVTITIQWQGPEVTAGQYSISTLYAETEHT